MLEAGDDDTKNYQLQRIITTTSQAAAAMIEDDIETMIVRYHQQPQSSTVAFSVVVIAWLDPFVADSNDLNVQQVVPVLRG